MKRVETASAGSPEFDRDFVKAFRSAPPNVTCSIDAAVRLIETELSGWWWNCGYCAARNGASLYVPGSSRIGVASDYKTRPEHLQLPGLEFWNIRDHSLDEIWTSSLAFNAFRGTAFLPEPCASCDRREIDFGGCRCQAFALTGDVRATDPVCHLSPHHALVVELAAVQEDEPYSYRRM
jgi:radical SAM protein with 4Fe4S-binding SPASM domain